MRRLLEKSEKSNDYFLYATVIFLGSFLLIVIQPLIGKLILPRFGGGASIWITLMFFFLTALFLGYLYTFWLSGLSRKTQRFIHGALIVISVVAIAINYFFHHALLSPASGASTNEPISSILILVIFGIGMPCFLLSTTSTLLQVWYVQKYEKKSPYSFYLISNLGSFIGLASYPFILEPYLKISQQSAWWLGLFILFNLGLGYITLSFLPVAPPAEKKPPKNIADAHSSPFFVWTALSVLSNTVLLATTITLTQKLPPIPLLWLLPLGLFFVSYIIAFSGDWWYIRKFHVALMAFVTLLCAFAVSYFMPAKPSFTFGIILLNCFITPLICHAELYRLRPDPSRLATYYMTIALGGVVAALICSVAASMFFPDFWEFPLSLIAACVLASAVLWKTAINWLQKIQYIFFGALAAFLVVYVFLPMFNNEVASGFKFLESKRNFYGVVKITEGQPEGYPPRRGLINGDIDHGTQIQSPENMYEPTLYYTRNSGIGRIIENHPKRLLKQPLRIGVVGLGAGTLAAYCNAGDYIRFYEINPAVISLSQKYFTYVSHCQSLGGTVDIVPGDARISMEDELDKSQPGKFDVLAVDAFIGDSIPVHLLTKEAINIYISHLADGGFIALHITNIYLDLSKPLEALMKNLNLYFYDDFLGTSRWFLISLKPVSKPFRFVDSQTLPDSGIRFWTDDYSNIVQNIIQLF